MYLDEFDGGTFSKPALQERQYSITQSGLVIPRLRESEFSQPELDILNFLDSLGYWTSFYEIRDRLKYLGKWAVSCTLSYLISLGYVRERIAW